MKFSETKLKGAYLIELEKISDARGAFVRQFCAREISGQCLPFAMAQVNRSINTAIHTFRGMHYQLAPHAETKIVLCTHGALLDIALDLRPESPTFKQWISEELTADNHRMLLLPKGMAHGFLTLSDNTEIVYMVDNFYAPQAERGVCWTDPEFSINLPHPPAVISDKDAGWPAFDPDYHLGSA